MKTTKQKVSYCIGLETARNLLRQFTDMDLKLLEEGFKDAISNANPKLEQTEVQSIMQALRQQVDQQQRQFFAKLSEDNRKQGESFLAENKQKDGIVTLNSGLQYKVLSPGTGPKPSPADVVSVHYRGSFIDGRIFDSSYERGKPHAFPVNRVIPGWSEALQLMRVGDKWQIFVPHYLAYGEAGFGNEIGPCTTLIFEMELLGIN
jgi:FKBP-type peptidyl-prolyl cis-trans isomerase FklB